jgi:hypothetical protein
MISPPPALGWTCFHCGETFTTHDLARDHFGSTPDRVPGCIIQVGGERSLLIALRSSEEQLDRVVAALREGADALRIATQILRRASLIEPEVAQSLAFMEQLWEMATEVAPRSDSAA